MTTGQIASKVIDSLYGRLREIAEEKGKNAEDLERLCKEEEEIIKSIDKYAEILYCNY